MVKNLLRSPINNNNIGNGFYKIYFEMNILKQCMAYVYKQIYSENMKKLKNFGKN